MIRNPRSPRSPRSYWPCVAACLTGVAVAYAADTLLHRGPVDPPAAVTALLVSETAPGHFAPEATQPLRFIQPKPQPTPLPTPLTPREQAAKELERLGQKPTGAALAQALRTGAPLSIALFLQAGVDPDALDGDGRPMLVVACEAENVSAAKQLLQAGANPDCVGPDGRTPLMIAAARGQTALMETLVQGGAELAVADREGHTALSHAVMAGDPEPVHWLIEHGFPPECGPCCGGAGSLVRHALSTGKLAVIEPVLQFEKPLHWQPETREALYAAVRRQDKPLARVLLANLAEPPTPEGARQPLLGFAIAWQEPATLRFLLECGADPNTPLGSPVEPVFSRLIAPKSMRYYLEKEAGMTPLMLAAGMGRLDMVETLLEHGAKRGTLTRKSKMAALSFAAQADNVEVMQRLLGKSPRPEDQHTRVEISLGGQRARLWKNGKLVFSAPVSTGRPGYATPAGRFVVTDKTRSRFSSIYKVEMPYFMRLSCSAVGMHAGVVPNHPASHGCIRLPYSAAVRFYHEVEVGTLVTIR